MSRSSLPVSEGQIIGVFGGGQLGRMFTQAAQQLGYRVAIFAPEKNSPAAQVADEIFNAPYDDKEAVVAFSKKVAVATVEFENIPAKTLEWAAEHCHVFPKAHVLHITQNRIREKNFLKNAGFPVAPFLTSKEARLDQVSEQLGYPFILKSAGFGYDGKGQLKVNERSDIALWEKSNPGADWVAEKLVDFKSEFSVIGARSAMGEYTSWEPIENKHRNHILDISKTPTGFSKEVRRNGSELTRSIIESLDAVGIICVEFFLLKNGGCLVNEIAPRPHNSGHLTIEASVTSQFTQQVLAICGQPLGGTEFKSAAAMANLLGDLWERGEPEWKRLPKDESVIRHLYGKDSGKPGRKMGHLTSLASTSDEAEENVIAARNLLLE